MAHVFSFANNGSRMEIQLGEEFTVVLDESPGTGYRWGLASALSQAIELLSDVYTVAGEGIGGGGQRRWRFRASNPGSFEITLKYAREWELPNSAINTFTLSGVVS